MKEIEVDQTTKKFIFDTTINPCIVTDLFCGTVDISYMIRLCLSIISNTTEFKDIITLFNLTDEVLDNRFHPWWSSDATLLCFSMLNAVVTDYLPEGWVLSNDGDGGQLIGFWKIDVKKDF